MNGTSNESPWCAEAFAFIRDKIGSNFPPKNRRILTEVCRNFDKERYSLAKLSSLSDEILAICLFVAKCFDCKWFQTIYRSSGITQWSVSLIKWRDNWEISDRNFLKIYFVLNMEGRGSQLALQCQPKRGPISKKFLCKSALAQATGAEMAIGVSPP